MFAVYDLVFQILCENTCPLTKFRFEKRKFATKKRNLVRISYLIIRLEKARPRTVSESLVSPTFRYCVPHIVFRLLMALLIEGRAIMYMTSCLPVDNFR